MASTRQSNHAFKSRGTKIMELAELLRPVLMEKLMGCYDENNLPVQPARIRGLALVMAQDLVVFREQQSA